MATQFVEGQPRARVERDRTLEIVGGGSMVEAIGAAAAVVLCILGLAGVLPGFMLTIATIVIGASLLVEGGAIVARYDRLLRWAAGPGEEGFTAATLGSGVSAESFAGVAGIALGILALLGVSPGVLASVALIVFGAGLLLGSAATSRINMITSERFGGGDFSRRLIRDAANASAGGEVLVGIGAMVLGILALVGVAPFALTLVGLLGVSAAMFLSGSAVGTRMMDAFRRSHA